MARLVGVKVEVFSIGFGKKLVCKNFKGTNWCISAVPLGGYVQMKGQDDSDPSLKSNDPDSYNVKSPWQKILILLGGPGFNFLLAIIIYFGVALSGWQTLAPIVGKTIPNTPAFKALKPGDKIIQINGYEIKSWNDIPKIEKKSNILNMMVFRNGKIIDITLRPKIVAAEDIFSEKVKRKIIGIVPSGKIIKVKYPLFEAIPVAFEKFKSGSLLIVKGLKKLFTSSVGVKAISGPIGIVDVTAKVANYGMQPLLLLMALLSVNLGILNLLPIPALDGGHIMFNLYEAVFKRELNEAVMIKLTIAGWVFLGGLMLVGMYNDITRLVGG